MKPLNHLPVTWRVSGACCTLIQFVIKSRVKSRGAQAHRLLSRDKKVRRSLVATMPRAKSGQCLQPGYPLWITASEWNARWRPEEPFEEEFQEQPLHSARRMLMNYFVFYPAEIADWVPESDRTTWYLNTTGSLTLLHLRDKVETYMCSTSTQRGSEDWMRELFTETWTGADVSGAPQGRRSSIIISEVPDTNDEDDDNDDDDIDDVQHAVASGDDVDLSAIDDDNPPVDKMNEVKSGAEPGTSSNMDVDDLVQQYGELGEMIAKRQEKVQTLDEKAKAIENDLRPQFNVGIVLNEDLRQAYLGKGDGRSGGGNGNSDDSNGALNPVQAAAAAVATETDDDATLANKLAQRAITLGLANVEAVVKAADGSAAVADEVNLNGKMLETVKVADGSAAVAHTSNPHGKNKMTAAQAMVAEKHERHANSDSDDDWTAPAAAQHEAKVGHKRTMDALRVGNRVGNEEMSDSTIAMVILAKDSTAPGLGAEPSDPNGDRSVVWLQNHHLAVNVGESTSKWRVFVMEHGESSFCAKEIFAGLGLLRPGASPMLLASAPICRYKEALSRNGKAGIPGDEIDLMLATTWTGQMRGHAMMSSVIRGINEVVTLKSVGSHPYVVLTFLQCFTHSATFYKDEAWLLDNYPHLVSLLHQPAAIVMAHDGTETHACHHGKAYYRLLLAQVEDMAPGTKDQIFTKGKGALLQKVNSLIKDEKECHANEASMLFDHDAEGRPIVSFKLLAKMQWATDVFKEESGYQGSVSASMPVQQSSQGSAAAPSKFGHRPAASSPAPGARSPAVASTSKSSIKSSSGSMSTQAGALSQVSIVRKKSGSSRAAKKRGLSSLAPLQPPRACNDGGEDDGEHEGDDSSLVASVASWIESFQGSPTQSEDVSEVLKRTKETADARFAKTKDAGLVSQYITQRTSWLVNGPWAKKLTEMVMKSLRAVTLDELRTIELSAQSYYEDLVSALNVLTSTNQKFNPDYNPRGAQKNTLEKNYTAVKHALAKAKTRLNDEQAESRKRSRGATPPLPLPLVPLLQSAVPTDALVQAITQITQVAQTAIAEGAKKSRTEAPSGMDGKVRELEMKLEMNQKLSEQNRQHGEHMEQLQKELEKGRIELARLDARQKAQAEMKDELKESQKAHFDSSTRASCFQGAMMMQYAGLGATSGTMSHSGMGAQQGMAALLGFPQSAQPLSLGFSQSTSGPSMQPSPKPSPNRFPQLQHKGPNETSSMPIQHNLTPDVALAVQCLMEEVEKTIRACLLTQNYDGPAKLQKGTNVIKELVQKIAGLNDELTEHIKRREFLDCDKTKQELDKTMLLLDAQMVELREMLHQLHQIL